MNPVTLSIVAACIAVLFAAIGKANRAAEGSNNPNVILNAVTLTAVAAVGIVVIVAMAALSRP